MYYLLENNIFYKTVDRTKLTLYSSDPEPRKDTFNRTRQQEAQQMSALSVGWGAKLVGERAREKLAQVKGKF